MVARQKTPAFGLSRSVVSPVTHPRHGGTAERPGPAADDSFADVADSGPRRAGPHPSRRCAHPASRSWSPGTSVGAYQRPSFIPGTQPRQRQQSVRGSGGGEHRGRAPEEDPSDDTDDGGQAVGAGCRWRAMSLADSGTVGFSPCSDRTAGPCAAPHGAERPLHPNCTSPSQRSQRNESGKPLTALRDGPSRWAPGQRRRKRPSGPQPGR